MGKGLGSKILKGIVTVPAIGAGLVLVGMMLLTVTDVALRFFFNHPISGSIELSIMMMVSLGFLGLAWCTFNRRHIQVDIIVSKLPPKIQRFFDIFNYILVVVVSGLIAVQSFNQGRVVKRLGIESQYLDVPQFIFYFLITFSYLLLLLPAVYHLFHSLASLVTGKSQDHRKVVQ